MLPLHNHFKIYLENINEYEIYIIIFERLLLCFTLAKNSSKFDKEHKKFFYLYLRHNRTLEKKLKCFLKLIRFNLLNI